jgi:hypothetical protein
MAVTAALVEWQYGALASFVRSKRHSCDIDSNQAADTAQARRGGIIGIFLLQSIVDVWFNGNCLNRAEADPQKLIVNRGLGQLV